MFRLLDWGDTVRLRVRDDGVIARHGESVAGVAEADDLQVRAAKLLQSAVEKHAKVRTSPSKSVFRRAAALAVDRRMQPPCWWPSTISGAWVSGIERLAELGLQLGADVPVFVRGDNAWAEGVGEKLTPIRLPPAWYVLVDPGVHVPTGGVVPSP